MAKLYYNLIKGGKWTLEDVPEKWREAVEKMIEADA
jgi:hypothetical protein